MVDKLGNIEVDDLARYERIVCPKCGKKQLAQVIFGVCDPWPTYVHECIECKYMITESEWESDA